MAKRISIKDIAEQVGVSTALVSYVLNGKEKEARIGVEMVEKVRKVASNLNYQPNLIARGLKFGKTKTLGLIVADISNPFFSSLARIIESEARKHDYTVIFGNSDEQLDKSQSLIDTFLSRQVDGLIVTPVEGSQHQINEVKSKGVPIVLIDRGFREVATHTIIINNRDSVYKAVKLLIRNGYKKIAMIAYDFNLTHMQERIRGYKEALKEAGMGNSKLLLIKVSYDNIFADIEKQLGRLVNENKIDALMLATNSISLNALKVITKLKINVPGQLGVVCFDESEAYEFFYTPITYVKQDLQSIGKLAVKIMIQEIEEQKNKKPESIIVKSSMVVGKSSGIKNR